MLEPQTRATLTEQLAPPSGFELSAAVGTTFTLDLVTALSVPLSFASRHVAAVDDKLGVLDAVRRSADRIDIFPQAGEIAMGRASDLVAFLEPMIHPVQAPRGLFHPKVWFLEYRSGERTAYRFLCASRNLTEDRSWDTIVRLDGRITDEAQERNRPLSDLLRALPSMAVHPLPRERRTNIARLADAFERVTWELPPDVRSVDFDVLGFPGAKIPDLSGIRALIVSPFVTDEGLRMLRKDISRTTHLLSRTTTLDRLSPQSLDEKLTTYVLDDAAVLDTIETTGAGDGAPTDHLSGLHAKIFVVDRFEGAQVLIGSANATDAAWNSNVEVMVRMTGPYTRLGVEATLNALGDLKDEYLTDGGDEESHDEEAQRRLEALVRSLAAVRLTARVLPGEPWSLRLWGESAERAVQRLHDEGVSLRWQLLTRADLGHSTLTAHEGDAATVHSVPLTDITPFIVLVAHDEHGNERRTIVLAELLDDVPERQDAIIARQLTDRAAFLRLLALLLDLGGGGLFPDGSGGSFTMAPASGLPDGVGIFEALVRAVGLGHRGLADARRIIDFIQTHKEADDLLPTGFEDLWANVWAAHRSLTRGR